MLKPQTPDELQSTHEHDVAILVVIAVAGHARILDTCWAGRTSQNFARTSLELRFDQAVVAIEYYEGIEIHLIQ